MYKRLSEVKQPLPDELYRPDIILQDATELEIFRAIRHTKCELTKYLDGIKDFPDYVILRRTNGNLVIGPLSQITDSQIDMLNNILKGTCIRIVPL